MLSRCVPISMYSVLHLLYLIRYYFFLISKNFIDNLQLFLDFPPQSSALVELFFNFFKLLYCLLPGSQRMRILACGHSTVLTQKSQRGFILCTCSSRLTVDTYGTTSRRIVRHCLGYVMEHRTGDKRGVGQKVCLVFFP